jgi:glutaredoxin 3
LDKEALAAMIKKTSQIGVPVFDIDGTIVIGFDRDKLEDLLK